MVLLKDIEDFFKDYIFKEQELRLSKAENIFALEKFIKSHTEILKGKTRNSVYKPYYERLLKVYLKLKK